MHLGCCYNCIDLVCLTETGTDLLSLLLKKRPVLLATAISRQHAASVVKVICLSSFTEIRIYLFYLLLNCVPFECLTFK